MVCRFRRGVFLSGLAISLIEIHSSFAALVALPAPDSNAYSTSFRYDNTGTLYAWDGLTVWKQYQGPNGPAYTSVGKAPAGNSADAGPINFSQNGAQILVGNGAGGNLGGVYSGKIFSLPKSGGNSGEAAGTVQFHADFIPVPAVSGITGSVSKYFVDEGDSSFSASSVSVFDSTTGLDKTVIANIPGASASVAFNPINNRLYAEIGYFGDAGQIRSFTLAQVDAAYNGNGPALDFSKDGTKFNSVLGNQSGAGLFFDSRGYLFAGGSDGITVFAPDGSLVYEQDPTGNSYATIAYNSVTDQVLESPLDGSNNATSFSAKTLESVPEPTGIGFILLGAAATLHGRRSKLAR